MQNQTNSSQTDTDHSALYEPLLELLLHKEIKGIFFDLDGTLVDSEPQTAEAIEDVLQEYGIKDGFLHPSLTSGQAWRSICASLASKYNGTSFKPSLEQALIVRWDELVRKNVQPVRGAIQAVREAKKHFSLSVVSSSPKYLINDLLESIGVSDLISLEQRIGGDEVTDPKPAPEAFLSAAKKMGISPQNALAFEDSPAGIQSAKSAGMFTIAIIEASREPEKGKELADAWINNFHDLPESFWKKLSFNSKQ